MAAWTEVSTLPYNFCEGSAVLLDGEIHILGSNTSYSFTKHYKYSNGTWAEVSTLPYNFYGGSSVVLNGEIHILGSNYFNNQTSHYKYSNGSWTEVSTLPYNFYEDSAVVLDGEIHILGSYSSNYRTKHYKYSNGSWTEVSTLPYSFYRSSAVVLDGEIHILGSNYFNNQTSHYKYSNGAWMEVSTLPYNFYVGSSVVLDGEIHILGGGDNNSTKHYKYSNGAWMEVSTLPYNFYGGSSVVLDGEIHILGSSYNAGNYTKHYRCYKTINKVVYGNESLIDLTDDTITVNDIMVGKIAHLPSGERVEGTGTSDATAVEGEIAREKTAYVGGSKITGTADILTCAKNVVFCRNRKVGMSFNIKVLNLNNITIRLLYDGGDVLLTNSYSSITIASPGASYVSTFYIQEVHYINRNQALITYRYETNASGLLSRVFHRLITLKSDRTLVQSSQINGSGAPTATVNMSGYIIPMFEAKTSWMLIYTATTISTGAMAIYVSRMYAALSTNTLTIPSSSTWTTVAASNADTKMPTYFNSYFSEYGGLFFYEGANSKLELDIWAGYSGGNKNVYASAAGDVPDSDFDVHILGKTSDGYLAIIRPITNRTISLYSYDPVTCYFKLVAEYDMPNYASLNIFLLNNGLLLDKDNKKLYTLTAVTGLELLAEITLVTEKDYPLSSEIGPLSDPFQGIFIS